MKEIVINSKVHGNQVMLCDDEDFEKLSLGRWALQKGANTFYAYKCIRENGVHKEKVYAHRILIECRNLLVDHKDGNGLNNQKSNLRAGTIFSNNHNSCVSKNNKCGIKGVHYDKERGLWQAQIMSNGIRHRLGRFKTKELAAKAWNEAAIKYHGEFARLNEITCVE